MLAIREAKWLFDSNIDDYLNKELYHNGLQLQVYEAELKGLPVGEQRTKMVQERSKLFQWFSEQYAALDNKMTAYLKLSH